MLPVEWRPKARQSLWTILETTQALPQHPYLYRPGRVASDRITILDVLHARQEYPPSR